MGEAEVHQRPGMVKVLRVLMQAENIHTGVLAHLPPLSLEKTALYR